MNRYFLLSLLFAGMVGCAPAPTETTAESPAPATASAPSPETQVANSPGESPTTAQATAVRSGSFVSGEHATQGTARLANKDGKLVLELDEKFKTSEMGPDLVVALHRSDDVIGSTTPPAFPLKEGDYVVLAPLEKFSGAQSYAIPSGVKAEDYKSAVIWCRKFNATFGAAKLAS